MVKIVRYPFLSAFNGTLDDVIRRCREAKNEELCGIVGGNMASIFAIQFVKNISMSPDYFVMDPVEMDSALEALDKGNYELVALFHSHRGDSAQLSAIDIEKASIDVPMIIISQKEIKAWNIKSDKTFDEFNLLIHDTRTRIPGGPIRALNTDGLRITVEVSGKVFEQLPGILTSYFESRNGPNFANRLQDLQQILQLAQMGMRPLREGDDPDALAGSLLNRTIHNPSPVISGCTLSGVTIASTTPERGGFLISSNNPLAPDIKKPKAPPHTHHYKKAHKSPDGHDIYECSVEHCDKTLTIDGEIESGIQSPRESIKSLAESIAVVEADQAIIVEVDKHGSIEEGGNPGGQDPDPKA